MDPLSIAASVAGLITISTQILGIIGSLKSKNNKELESLVREVTAVRGILCQIQGIVQFQSTKSSKNSEWLDTLNTTLDDCGDTYLGLQKELQGLSSVSKLDSLKKKVRWKLKEDDIQEILRKIESYKLSLDLLLSVQTSTTTTHIEEILVQVKGKLLLKEIESPAVRTPLSWRKRLAGLDSGSAPAKVDDHNTAPKKDPSDNNVGIPDTSFIVSSLHTAGWDMPGIYGIQQDEGSDAPDLNNPELTSIHESKVGEQRVSLICEWQDASNISQAMQPLRVHILFKGPKQGDLYFVQLEESLSMRPIGRFVAPVGASSLIIARCDNKHSVCLLDDLDSLEDKGSFHLILGNYALKSSPKSQQILVNFETSQDRDAFLEHFYALRFLQRMDFAFATPTKLYNNCVYQNRAQHVQIGYADGTEKSFIYPYFYLLHSLEDGSTMVACSMKPNSGDTLFKENLSELDIEIVGTETIVCMTQDGSAINNISITFSSANELFQTYHRLHDIIREWDVLRQKRINEYERKKEWKVGSLEFLEDSINPTRAFCTVKVILEVDNIYKRMRIEIFEKDGAKKLGSGFVMASSVLFFKEHFRDTDPDFFSFPTVQAGFWDLRDGGMATADNFKTGQIRIRGLNEKLICDELEEFVEKFLEERQGKQRKFLTEIR